MGVYVLGLVTAFLGGMILVLYFIVKKLRDKTRNK